MENHKDKQAAGWRRLLWRYWWGPALMLTVAVVAWGFWWHQPPPPPPPEPAAESSARMETLCLTEIQQGDKRWVLDGRRADFHNERDEISVTDVRVEFFGTKEHVKIRGKDGLLNTKTRVLTLRGNVEIESGDLLCKTSVIIYQPEERVLLGPEDLTLETPRLKVQGKGLRLYMADKKLSLAQHKETELKGKGPTP